MLVRPTNRPANEATLDVSFFFFFKKQKFLMHNIQSLNEYKKWGGG